MRYKNTMERPEIKEAKSWIVKDNQFITSKLTHVLFSPFKGGFDGLQFMWNSYKTHSNHTLNAKEPFNFVTTDIQTHLLYIREHFTRCRIKII